MRDIAVLVVSCDKYADAWDYFFWCFARFWPDCPWPICLGTNFRECEAPGVRTICVGADSDWSSNLLAMLDQVEEPRICLFLDDYFLTAPVDTQRAQRLAHTHATAGAGMLLLSDPLPPDRPLAGVAGVGCRDRGAPYRVSLNAAIWNVDVLRSLLRPGENPWQFELAGSRRSDALPNPFLVASPRLVHLDPDGIARGKWCPSTITRARRLGFAIDTQSRPMLSRREVWERTRGLPKKWIVRGLPWKVRFRLGDLLIRLGLRAAPSAPRRVVW